MGVPARTPGAIHTSERAERTARRMRRDLTFAEKQLWQSAPLAGSLSLPSAGRRWPRYVGRFRPATDRELIVEVDGGVHDIGAVAARDNERDAWLAERGYRVVRITNCRRDHGDRSSRSRPYWRPSMPAPPPLTPPRKGEGNEAHAYDRCSSERRSPDPTAAASGLDTDAEQSAVGRAADGAHRLHRLPGGLRVSAAGDRRGWCWPTSTARPRPTGCRATTPSRSTPSGSACCSASSRSCCASC